MGLQQHPIDILYRSQPASMEEYDLGSGDEVAVDVVGRPELSGPQVIGPDGRITLPVAGSVVVGGLSREEATKAITAKLAPLYKSPAVEVRVTKYGSNHVLLLGDIEHPGVLYFDGVPTLLEAITRGGALTGTAQPTHLMPQTCIIYRPNQVLTVSLKEVMRVGDIRLRRNDIVYVPGEQERLVSVLGQVKSPGAVPLREQTTLASLLADAGGLTPEAGDPTIQIFNPKTGSTQRVQFKDLMKPKGKDVTLEVGDIVYVPKSGLASLGFVLQQISPLAQVGTVATLATR